MDYGAKYISSSKDYRVLFNMDEAFKENFVYNHCLIDPHEAQLKQTCSTFFEKGDHGE